MAHPSPSRTSACADQGRYKLFSGAGQQRSKSSISEPQEQRSFWSSLAKRAKSVLVDDGNRPCSTSGSDAGNPTPQYTRAKSSAESTQRRTNAPVLQKGFEAITSSLSILGGSIGNALEEGLNMVETKATDLMSSDSHLLSKKKRVDSTRSSQLLDSKILEDVAADKETQLKASRDVAMAMAAKAKLLARELKTMKADLAFAKDRCMQLEEENKRVRESLANGLRHDEDDLVRIQLETLLAEKARLAQENAYYARENCFLREVVAYHQLTMQDVVSLDDNIVEAAEMACEPDTEVEFPPERVISTVSG